MKPDAVRPDLSLVIPCYNEEEVVAYTIGKLLEAFKGANIHLEIVAVDNGSTDQTGEIINRLATTDSRIIPVQVAVNEGYGNGILRGFRSAAGQWVGSIPADGQVDAEDVLRLFEAARVTNGLVLAKVRRRFRMDGLLRKAVSISYNFFFRALWPGIRTLDVNGSPKIVRREWLEVMNVQSKGWLLDPEMVVKAGYLGLRILELNVFARMRGTGLSHVRAGTCWEFFRDLLMMRLSGKRRVIAGMNTASQPSTGTRAEHLIR